MSFTYTYTHLFTYTHNGLPVMFMQWFLKGHQIALDWLERPVVLFWCQYCGMEMCNCSVTNGPSFHSVSVTKQRDTRMNREHGFRPLYGLKGSRLFITLFLVICLESHLFGMKLNVFSLKKKLSMKLKRF